MHVLGIKLNLIFTKFFSGFEDISYSLTPHNLNYVEFMLTRYSPIWIILRFLMDHERQKLKYIDLLRKKIINYIIKYK